MNETEFKTCQAKAISDGIVSASNLRPFNTLRMECNGTPKDFHILSTLSQVSGCLLELAVTGNSGELVIVKKLIDEQMESSACSSISALTDCKIDSPNIYKPKIFCAGTGHWTGLEPAYAVVYPYVTGIPLEKFYAEIKNQPRAQQRFLQVIIQLCEQLEYLKAKKVPGIWDLNSGNIFVKPNDQVMLIDYELMKFEPTPTTVISMIKEAFASEQLSQEMTKLLNIKYDSITAFKNALKAYLSPDVKIDAKSAQTSSSNSAMVITPRDNKSAQENTINKADIPPLAAFTRLFSTAPNLQPTPLTQPGTDMDIDSTPRQQRGQGCNTVM